MIRSFYITFIKHSKYSIFFYILVILFYLKACSEKESSEDSFVRFETIDQQISTDDLHPVTFQLSIDPPAPEVSNIIIDLKSTGGREGISFEINPSPFMDQIELPVDAGDSQAIINIAPIADGIGFSNILIELEIIGTGEGLSAEGLFGIYSSLTILNNKDQQRSLPFQESFDECESGRGGLPPGWEEKVIVQNSFGTGHWVCSGSSRGIECNAFTSNGINNDSSEVWLLTPPISLMDENNPFLSFDTDRRFNTQDFQEYDVKISTNYDGNNLESANWAVLAPAVSAIEASDPDFDNYVSVSNLDLSAYKDEIITIAFIYYARGSGTNSTILRLDDVRIE